MNDTTCPCGTRDTDNLHRARCNHRHHLRADVIAHAAAAGITAAHAADLWAHLGNIYAEGQQAHRAAIAVIDLGWRP